MHTFIYYWKNVLIRTLIPCVIFFAGFQFAALSIVTSSTSELFKVFNMPHIYWSTSRPSNCAGLLLKEEKTNK